MSFPIAKSDVAKLHHKCNEYFKQAWCRYTNLELPFEDAQTVEYLVSNYHESTDLVEFKEYLHLVYNQINLNSTKVLSSKSMTATFTKVTQIAKLELLDEMIKHLDKIISERKEVN